MLLVFLKRELLERPVDDERRVVDEDVDPAIFLGQRPRGRFARRERAEIDAHVARLGAMLLRERGGEGLAVRPVGAVPQDDASAGRGQGVGLRLSEGPERAGQKR